MRTARYFIALILLIGLPPGLLLWFAIHPFVRFWRRLGPGWTYALLAVPTVGLMAGTFALRGRLLAVDFGTNYVLVSVALICVSAGALIAVKRRKHLPYGVLAGLPELSRTRYPGRLSTEGIYGTIRHPRYVEVFLWSLGYACFANFLAPYIAIAAAVPVLYVIVLLEEQELRDRFGAEYEAYCANVPRFVPRR